MSVDLKKKLSGLDLSFIVHFIAAQNAASSNRLKAVEMKEKVKDRLIIFYVVAALSAGVILSVYFAYIDIRAKQAIIELNEKTK
jgi:hypothetical protein